MPGGFRTRGRPHRPAHAPGGVVRARVSRLRGHLRRRGQRRDAGPRTRSAGVAPVHARRVLGQRAGARPGVPGLHRLRVGAMMWIEVLSRHHEVVGRYRAGDEARIGRAYDNDVVLDDPFVAPHHVRIARDETGALVAEDLGSVNGLYTTESNARVARVPLDGQAILRVGRTLLRVRAPEFAVGPERAVGPVARVWPVIAALSVTVIVLSALTLWLNETHEPQPSRYFLPLLGVVVVVLVWTTGWTVLSRIFTGVAHFDLHLLIALCGLLAFFAFDELADYGSFALSSRGLADYAYVGNWILFAMLCFVHLRAM